MTDQQESPAASESPRGPAGTDMRAPGPDGGIHARTQAEQANEELQEENAETALDQPSDGVGDE